MFLSHNLFIQFFRQTPKLLFKWKELTSQESSKIPDKDKKSQVVILLIICLLLWQK